MQLNTLHQSNWKMGFSNLPTIEQSQMYLYDNFVTSITLPNYDLQEEKSYFQNSVIRHPVTKANADLPQLQITFRTTEDFQNYYKLMLWSMQIKYGRPENWTDAIRNYTIKAINLYLLDNQKREKCIVTFTNCFMSSISSIGLTHGSSDECLFTASFTYEEIQSTVL